MERNVHPDKGRQRLAARPTQLFLVGMGLLLSLIWIFPIYWMLVTSITPRHLILSDLRFIPTHFTLQNYQTVFADTPVLRWFVNSLVTPCHRSDRGRR
jgi:ABC-type glycerol-3-phosphate transport system permease component